MEKERCGPKACLKSPPALPKSNFQVDTTCPFVLFSLLPLYIFHGTVDKKHACSPGHVYLLAFSVCSVAHAAPPPALKKMEMFSYDHPSAFLHSDALGLYCVCPSLSNRVNGRWLNNVGTINFSLRPNSRDSAAMRAILTGPYTDQSLTKPLQQGKQHSAAVIFSKVSHFPRLWPGFKGKTKRNSNDKWAKSKR